MNLPSRLTEPLRAYRLGDPLGRWTIYSPDGAQSVDGRWHRRGDRVIYASERYSTAMLELLVRWNSVPPPAQSFVEIVIPAGTSCESVEAGDLTGWDTPESDSARAFGHRWYADRRSAILLVPSVVARLERNVLINAEHSEFGQLKVGAEIPVRWDERLFR